MRGMHDADEMGHPVRGPPVVRLATSASLAMAGGFPAFMLLVLAVLRWRGCDCPVAAAHAGDWLERASFARGGLFRDAQRRSGWDPLPAVPEQGADLLVAQASW